MMKWLEERGIEVIPDGGVEIEIGGKSYFVKCAYLGLYRDKVVVCADLASPTASEPVKKFIESYARIRGARYAVVESGEEIWIYDVLEKETVEDLDLEMEDEIKADAKDFRIAAAYYNLIRCKCGVDDEGNSVCGLSPKR